MTFRSTLSTATRPGRWSAALVVLFLSACVQTTLPVSGGGACETDADCGVGSGLKCRNNICTDPSAVCSPGRRTCDGSSVIRCTPDSLGYAQETACKAGCANGQCVVPVCEPGEVRCAGSNIVQRCSDDGTAYVPTQICARDCDELTASCNGERCPPGARQCEDGVTLKVCNSAGSAWSTVACDRPDPGRCVTGGSGDNNLGSFCERYSCTPFAARCDGLALVSCNADGKGETAVALCSHGCSAGACTSAVCQPGAERCSVDGLSRERCNDLGTAWQAQSCVADGLGGCALTYDAANVRHATCLQPVCTPRVRVCRGDQWIECAEDGLSETVLATCDFGCDATNGCTGAACAAGEQKCVGASRQICSPNRLGFLTDEYCLAGCTMSGGIASCLPLVCGPQEYRCGSDGVSIERCKADGTGWTSTACDSGQICQSGYCVASGDPCPDGARRCVASTVQICSNSGGSTGYTTVGQCLGACSESQCDSAGGCRPFSLGLAPGQGSLIADGRSTYRIVSERLVGPDGTPIPEDTVLNVWVDGAILVSADGSSLQGMQVPVKNGTIQVIIQAPALPGEATIGARVRDRSACSGVAHLSFSRVAAP